MAVTIFAERSVLRGSANALHSFVRPAQPIKIVRDNNEWTSLVIKCLYSSLPSIYEKWRFIQASGLCQ